MVEVCRKAYLYFSSLKKHIKQAHPEFYKEKIATNLSKFIKNDNLKVSMSDCLVPGGDGAKALSEESSEEDLVEESLLTEEEESKEEEKDVEMIEVKEEMVKKEEK
jgi:hypothetical protein